MSISDQQINNVKYIASVLADLHSVWMPHAGQIPIGRALFTDGKKDVVLECGRKFGKTDALCYSLWRWALTNPNSYNYYFAPLRDQIMDLVWANGRLPEFLPEKLRKKYVKSVNNTDKRIVFNNGSFIKCDGSDNHEKARGYSATGLTCYDETKDFHKEFHVGFNPNRAINNSPMLAVGTPGGGDDLLSNLWDAADGNKKRGAAFRAPTSLNPHISKEFLEEERRMAELKGELEIFLIEYEAQRIKLGSKFIFPMLTKASVNDYTETIEHLKKFRKDYDFYIAADPGSAKCFAVVFGAVHRFDKHIIIIDEIYEKNLGENSVKKIAPRILDIVNAINPNYDDWRGCYDHAATWFFSELQASFEDYPIYFEKCEKDYGKKESKLSLIKDAIIASVFTMTERNKDLYKEMVNYMTKNGVAVKENDHAIDALRYLLNLANYTSIEEARPVSYLQKFPRGTFEQDETREREEEGEVGYEQFDDWIGIDAN